MTMQRYYKCTCGNTQMESFPTELLSPDGSEFDSYKPKCTCGLLMKEEPPVTVVIEGGKGMETPKTFAGELTEKIMSIFYGGKLGDDYNRVYSHVLSTLNDAGVEKSEAVYLVGDGGTEFECKKCGAFTEIKGSVGVCVTGVIEMKCGRCGNVEDGFEVKGVEAVKS